MKKIIIPFFCAVLFSVPATAQQTSAAPVKAELVKSKLTPKEVIDNYFKALGGKTKLEAVKSTVIDNTLNVQGMDITMNSMKMGNKFKSEQTAMGQKVTQVFDGEKGYIERAGQKSDFPADNIAELKKGTTLEALAFNPSNFQSVTVEKIDAKDYNVLSSEKGKFYFDAATGLLYKSTAAEGSVTVKNYMTVEGLKFPSEIDIEGKGQKVTIKTTKVVLNSGVSDADFK
ncbi:hypothetical protein [Chryseobacterium vrystaatense]|uniref:Uncharacterized protein n=1 Tax=Chryseobacterium vrystaatense TaxID=307480 RepID=A0A1M5PM12_9FLAO|nr:hypothetical protein [Chryseobacterium vrystaatense]KFF23891.1 hypothetical protein IW16_21085 [Chryseobacterium vrystaatense]SHH02293.1 hypothetical protein SAMN02787073_0118 [Chryseobacterium vrystaatense]